MLSGSLSLLLDRRLLLDYRSAARHYGVSVTSMVRRAARLQREGFEPRDALQWGLLDTRLPDAALAGCISKRRLIAMQRRLNPRSLMSLTEDKSIFYAYCHGVGLPAPRLYAVFEPIGWSSTGQRLAREAEWVDFFEHTLPDEFVIKPAWGVYGRSVRVIRRVGRELVDHAGAPTSGIALYRDLVSDPNYRKFVIQERMRNHPSLDALSGTESLQTLRLVTYIGRDGATTVRLVLLHVIASSVPVDNFRGGQTGNLLALVRAEDGVVGTLVGSVNGRPFLSPVATHPRTNVPVAGFRLPLFDEAKALAIRAAAFFLPARTIGWDMAVTPSGPVLIEGNAYWDPFNYVDANSPSGGDPGMPALFAEMEEDAKAAPTDGRV
jgi:hypothetical protein